MTPHLIEACASIDTVCPHFHIPLQSGDSRILAAMKRGYDTNVYLETIDRIRSRIPHATFGTDIIVGFPGEDEAAFANTCDILDAVGYSNLHAFRYSPRRGTAAADFPHQVTPNTKRQRAETLITQWQDGLGSVLDNRIGSTQDVLVEEHRDNVWRGYTHDYLYVKFPSERKIPVGSLLPVRVIGRMGATLEGVDDHRTDAS
jgi:threonylcarbamoyladenosine tRNA methylthiotransferase MtaB